MTMMDHSDAAAKHAAQAAVLALFFPMTDAANDDCILGTA
jgi:hypothetical protein